MPRLRQPLLAPSSPISRQHRLCLWSFNQDVDSIADASYQIEQATLLPLTALVLPKSLARAYHQPAQLPLVMTLNGPAISTSPADLHSPLVCTVKEAAQLNAQAVAYTIYLGSSFEAQMIEQFKTIVRQAKKHRLLTIAVLHSPDYQPQQDPHANLPAFSVQMASQWSADYIQLTTPVAAQHYPRLVAIASKSQLILDLTHLQHDQAALIEAVQKVITTGVAGISLSSNLDALSSKTTNRLSQLLFG